jgi:hypothetical protein
LGFFPLAERERERERQTERGWERRWEVGELFRTMEWSYNIMACVTNGIAC